MKILIPLLFILMSCGGVDPTDFEDKCFAPNSMMGRTIYVLRCNSEYCLIKYGQINNTLPLEEVSRSIEIDCKERK